MNKFFRMGIFQGISIKFKDRDLKIKFLHEIAVLRPSIQ
ncbi:hypothetical protein LEP1GSC168_1075 [Leptospira santarosai str. HAI134]|uniref:Uncharacterized protein n=1 Tax=Leptospira santarosai str. ZUN179 TaxID=1049985 RepID=M6VC90_9LEPT|nr:hypothetical protein LEP1GSC168_1075 [Leptospira santarosai str. HAI134]EMO47138.1 hypothetical protein LEP1GSC187_1129 [Leptospira santarosai str. ZUN179]